jgi:hypothetical protein
MSPLTVGKFSQLPIIPSRFRESRVYAKLLTHLILECYQAISDHIAAAGLQKP